MELAIRSQAPALDKYSHLEKAYHTIAPSHDLVVRLIEFKQHVRIERGHEVSETRTCKVHECRVTRQVLINSGFYFRKLLTNGFKESKQDIVDIEEDGPPAGTIVWFKIMHDAVQGSGYNITTDASAYSLTIAELWYMLLASHKYELDPKSEAAKTWFAGWYRRWSSRNTERPSDNTYFEQQRQLLFPTHTFDHPRGFMTASKYLVYNSVGHATEARPAGFKHYHLRLDQAVTQSINAARGTLKGTLHEKLFEPIADMLGSPDCRCVESIHHSYAKSLYQTGAWPVDTAIKHNSLEQLFQKLDGFPGSVKQPVSCGGRYCGFDFDTVVEGAVSKTRKDFDGLCLDCMNASKAKFGDTDVEYWNHAKLKEWDKDCRVKHKQPTWYFSYMGRREEQIRWQRILRERRD